MIKELTENPDKRFKIKNGKATVGISDSRLQWLDDEDVEVEFVLTELILHDVEWEEFMPGIFLVYAAEFEEGDFE